MMNLANIERSGSILFLLFCFVEGKFFFWTSKKENGEVFRACSEDQVFRSDFWDFKKKNQIPVFFLCDNSSPSFSFGRSTLR